MARLKGILKIEGKVDDLVIYRTKYGLLIRRHNPVSRKRLAKDPVFKRRRENMAEFGMASRAAKLVRVSFHSFIKTLTVGGLHARLTGAFSAVKKLDSHSAPGKRTVVNGLATTEGRAVLKEFNFNPGPMVAGILRKPYSIDLANGVIRIIGFQALGDVKCPAATTHVRFKAGFARLDFAAASAVVEFADEVSVGFNDAAMDIILAPKIAPVLANAVSFLVLGIDFYQEVNGKQYLLNNGEHNVLEIAAVG